MQTKEKFTDTVGYTLTPGQKFYRFIKAVSDFCIGLVAVIVLSPVFLAVAIAIKLDSPGPVFFKQPRVGYGGKLFTCIKFRSMAMDARPDVAGYEYKEVNNYITKVGAFIRKTSLDELPQFFCMMAGTMSLIGYRPAQDNETELNEARERYNMYQIRPGISGWAQVNGRDILAAQPTRKAQFDNYYLQHFSLWIDIKIFFSTIVKVFGSKDVEEGVLEEVAQPEEISAEEKEMDPV